MNELYDILRASYGAPHYEAILTGYSAERPVSLRVNPLKISREEAIRTLEADGFDLEPMPWYDCAFLLRKSADLSGTDLYREGKIYLQSLSSMLPPLYLSPRARETVLDMTAAPGGKTTEMYALSEGKALITACERDKIRFDRLRFNLARQGADRVLALHRDASALEDGFSFDKILLDAPCTGSGTLSAAAPVRFSSEYLAKCVKRQEKLLKKAFTLLKKGGTLVYSTCSVLPAEDGDLVLRFLRETGATLVPIAPFEGIPLLPSPSGTVCVCPSELYEGFFIAKFTK